MKPTERNSRRPAECSREATPQDGTLDACTVSPGLNTMEIMLFKAKGSKLVQVWAPDVLVHGTHEELLEKYRLGGEWQMKN